MPSLFVLSVGTLAVTYLFLHGLALIVKDEKEPPAEVGIIPFVAPLFGMMVKGGSYYTHLRDKYHLPIYTLRVPGPPIYIVNSLRMIQRIDRHISTVAFSPIQAQACEKAMAVSKSGMAKIAGDKKLAEDGYMRSFPRSTAAGFSPGPGLNELSRIAVADFTEATDRVVSSGKVTVGLFDWVRHQIFAATTDATYGPHNPFRDAAIERNWFEFESGILFLLLGIFPNILARRSLRAREALVSVLNRYFHTNKHLEGSLFLQLRQKHNTAFGLDPGDFAHMEIGQIAAGVVNTAPSAFWMVWQVFSNPEILHDCREEVSQLAHINPDDSRSIDLSKVRTHCPILVSTWQEVLRFHGVSSAARLVQEDTIVDEQYLLKKGGVVLMPNPVVHTDESLWGQDAREFKHKRFLKGGKDGWHNPAAAFRGFGGGHVLCPGRHFASTEVLALVALLLLRVELRPVGGKWAEPQRRYALDRAFPLLKGDIRVELISRGAHKWHVTFSDDEHGVNIVAEDLE